MLLMDARKLCALRSVQCLHECASVQHSAVLVPAVMHSAGTSALCCDSQSTHCGTAALVTGRILQDFSKAGH
jgi:hypothetical protein